MAKKFADLRKTMSAEARAQAEEKTRRMLAGMPLKKLRIERGFSQEEISRRLGVSQARVSKVERHADLCIQTLYAHIEAMGGKLKIYADFPEGQTELSFPREDVGVSLILGLSEIK